MRPAAGRRLLAELIRREATRNGVADVKEIMRRHGVEYALEAALSLAREAGFSDEEIIYDAVRDAVYVRPRPRVPPTAEGPERRQAPRRGGVGRGRGRDASGGLPASGKARSGRGAGLGKTLLDFAGPDGDTGPPKG
ncbi:MAG: hypothetical protein RXR01_09330 [Thermoproteus sp.]